MAGLMSKLDNSIESEEVDKLVYVKGDDGSYRGWEKELLKEEITSRVEAKFVLCTYCKGVMKDACFFQKEGKQEIACFDCIPKDVNKQIAEMNRDIINEKQAQCPLKSKGCDWSSELSELLHHLEECGLFPVACPLGCRDERGEVSRVERREVETHKTCCPMRTVHCEYCTVNMKSCEMNQHLEVCEEFPVPCPNECGQGFNVKRKDKPIHLSEECPLQLTECPYSQYGCEVKVQRRNLDQHEKEDMHKHFKLSMEYMQVKVSMFERDKKDTNDELQLTMNRMTKLEDENEMLRKCTLGRGSLEWKISGVKENISQNKDTHSDPFYVGLYKFIAKIGWVREENNVGFYLHVMKGEWDDTLKWPIWYKFKAVLINQLDAKNNFEANGEITEETLEMFPECLNKPISEKNKGMGPPKFISHADILQEKYSKDDTVMLKISVEQILIPFS